MIEAACLSIGSFCQSSSVMNGMKGCSRRRAGRARKTRVACAALRAFAVRAARRALDELDVPVAELVPEEVVERLRRVVEAEAVERRLGVARGGRRGARGSSGRPERASAWTLVERRRRASSRCMRAKRVAFQILLAKVR